MPKPNPRGLGPSGRTPPQGFPGRPVGPRGGALPPVPPGGLGRNVPNPPPGAGGVPGVGGGGGGGSGSGSGGSGRGAAIPHNCRQPRRGLHPQNGAQNNLQGADPKMVVILDRLIATEERKQEDVEEFHKVSQKFTMFPMNKFDAILLLCY